MRDVEFVPGPSDESDGSEELGGSGRRRIPPWLIAVVVVVVAAFVVVAILNRTGHPSAAPPAPTITAAGSPQSSASTAGIPFTFHVPLPAGVGQPFQLGFPAHVFDVAVTSESVWALTDRGLVQLLPDGTREVMSLGGARLPSVATSGSARLVVDEQADLIWVVVEGTRRGWVVAYNISHGIRIAGTSTPPIKDAAALGGLLYITSGKRLLSVSTAPAVHTVAALPRPLSMVAADPSRGRLLVLDFYAQRSRVWSIVTTTGGLPRVSGPTPVHVYPAGLVVANGNIWVGGFDDGYGSLFRLDPTRLQAVPHSGDRSQFATGSVPITAGDSVLWVRDSQGNVLHCLDARTGRDLQDWSIDGPVASRSGLAVAASRAGLVPLQLSACQG